MDGKRCVWPILRHCSRIFSLHFIEHDPFGKRFQVKTIIFLLCSSFLCDESFLIIKFLSCVIIHKPINYWSNTTSILTTATGFSFHKQSLKKMKHSTYILYKIKIKFHISVCHKSVLIMCY